MALLRIPFGSACRNDLGSAARSIQDPVIGTCRRGSTSSTNKVGVKALNQPVDERPHPATDVAVGGGDQIKRLVWRLPIFQHRHQLAIVHVVAGGDDKGSYPPRGKTGQSETRARDP